ncbi:MAG: NAD(+)/NADH kinase [Schwartzia sp.]|nr:NAD(+)/NADH kinase [Schwartzia sp. (in: firmicutes)]MBR1886354.1 NAD(+)/NADH kinase [Schwartzia sp. (in: firmicutes)]
MRRIAVFPNIDKEDAPQVLARIIRFFEDKDVQLMMPPDDAAFFHCEAYGVPDIDNRPMDMALSLGGDGTLLGVCRRVYEKNVPVCGVNIGTFGFLADIEPTELEANLEKILRGEYYLEERMVISGFVASEGKSERFLGHAINDVVVTKGGAARMLQLGLTVGGCHVMDYKADGLIVSTATGSTAYSLSAGGPLINPKAKVLLMTPICPHTFNARPIVMDEDDEIKIDIAALHRDIVVTFDGQESFHLLPGDAVIVRRAQLPTKIVKFDDKNYYRTLRTKLLYNA